MGIECDIQRSRDNAPMVFHDWELARLTDQEGDTSALNMGEFTQLRLLGTHEHPVPLARFLAIIGGQVPLLIEIKSKPGYDVDLTCECVSAALADYAGDHAIMSFDPRVGQWFAEHDSERIRGLVCTDTLDLGFLGVWRQPGALEQAQPDFLAMDIRDLPNALCETWRAARRPLLSWTIRSKELREQSQGLIDAPIAEGEGIA